MLRRILILVVVAVACAGACFGGTMRGISAGGTELVAEESGGRGCAISKEMKERIEKACGGANLSIVVVKVDNTKGTADYTNWRHGASVGTGSGQGLACVNVWSEVVLSDYVPNDIVELFWTARVPKGKTGVFARAFLISDKHVRSISLQTDLGGEWVTCH